MKRFLVLILLAALFALPALAQFPASADPTVGVVATGKIYQTAAAIDTVHCTVTKAASVAATKWRGPIPIYKNTGTGAMRVSEYSLANSWYVYARKPFTYKGIFPSGDSTGVYSINVDTTLVNIHNAYSLHTYPVWAVIDGPFTQLRLDPAASDTVYAVPRVIKR